MIICHLAVRVFVRHASLFWVFFGVISALFITVKMFENRPVCILTIVLHITTFPVLYIFRFMYTAEYLANFSHKIPR